MTVEGRLLPADLIFDTFIAQSNGERPHQALAMDVPADVYVPSTRPYRGLQELTYPFHDWTATVTTCGRLCWNRRKINLSQVFAGQNVGVRQVSERIWLVTFMEYDLGYFDDETCRLEPINNPFGPNGSAEYSDSTRSQAAFSVSDLCTRTICP